MEETEQYNRIKEKLNTFRKELHKANYNYYVLNKPTMSDYDYDMLMKLLESIEARYPELCDADSPTQKPGSDNVEDYPDEIK